MTTSGNGFDDSQQSPDPDNEETRITDGTPDGAGHRARVGGRYELGELLGRGGMAEVRKGNDVRLGRVVAVKRLRTDLASDPTFQARFKREAQSAASLNHPAIVAVYDTGEELADDDSGHPDVAQPYIVMEYVAGRTLRDIVREGRKILPERALEITSGVLSALDYSHRAGIVHRDIKPANVMLTPAGDVKVMDFGIARAIADSSSTMTQTAAVIGTAQYLSPEQARGETVDSRSDVYSTGCLLYELLTGRPPFVGDSPVSVAVQHVRDEPAPPSSLDPELSPEIDAIVMKALTKRIEDRYQSASAMRADIERFLAGKPVVAPAFVAGAGAAEAVDDATTIFDGSDHDDEDNRPKRWPLVLLALGVVALLVAAAIVGPMLFKSAPNQTAVPSVIGMTKTQADRQLQAAGLQLGDVTSKASSDTKKGHIISQDPGRLAMLDPGGAVDVVISTGKPNVIVPDVLGIDKKNAAQQISARGLRVRLVKQQADQPRNTVVDTDPRPATRVTKGSLVKVYYSTGPHRVPVVVGKSQKEATSALKRRGFNVDVVYDSTTVAKKGEVLKQSPPGGTTEPKGYTVTITVSSYEPPPTPTNTPTPTETPTQSESPSPTLPTLPSSSASGDEQ
ncbi:MAG TPA: Stk1 family PASTA domain-containing Ser/Thr kinase [Nocardioidaceae bacterium]|nr:Stk1 family PASTA domain-containing Ser/Thr kinase [Nocardioidaceae bacterium]